MVFLLVSIFSCQSEKSKTATKEDKIEKLKAEGYVEDTQYKDISEEQIAEWRIYAKEAITFRKEKDSNKAWQILDVDMWEYEFEYKNQKISDVGEKAGYWIDFNEDLTYSYGFYENELGAGLYHYNFDNKDLLLLDNDPNKKPLEYKAKIVNAVMVLQGNPTYRDNAYQAKLKRITEIPKKN